ncbi:class I SAM-dependent methyltransferase [Aquabacterium humicola]|uniref:class I SAM-dependent methyltransferase n=1 Tax=Aquabacterium humicola TaxID=3237377 RepID=UPI0025433A5D|nr:class I SAM-dependent methyltransferase [Rubrivivax pictus]
MTESHNPWSAALDERIGRPEQAKWATFYERRDRACPFFVDAPDENLVRWLRAGRIAPGHALDLGCGHGRNALHLARAGFRVRAVDYSPSAVAWARERIAASGLDVRLAQQSVFDLDPAVDGDADFVYDSGCFHHLPPHRRTSYVDLVARLLKPGAHFGLVCFRPEGGSGLTDDEVLERGHVGGGLGYTERQLRDIWSRGFDVLDVTPMEEHPPGSDRFGRSFLWAVLACRLGG